MRYEMMLSALRGFDPKEVAVFVAWLKRKSVNDQQLVLSVITMLSEALELKGIRA